MKLAAALALVLTVSLAGQDAKRGKQLYETSTCHVCHGKAGDGRGEAMKNAKRPMKPPPAAFQARLKHGDDLASIMKSIRKGIPGTNMIGYQGIMTEEQIADLASYIQTLRQQKAGMRD